MRRIRIAVDADISPRIGTILEHLYGRHGFEFTHVTAFAHSGAKDEFWADAFKRFGGHVTLSADSRIAYKPHQAIALKIAHLMFWWPTIEAKIREGSTGGALWRIPCNVRRIGGVYADLRLTSGDLEALRIPDDVIERARQERDANRAFQADSAGVGGGREQGPVRRQSQASRSVPSERRRRQRNGRQGNLKV